ncbi:hypothetical protein J7K52_02960 [Candidatus Bathyarchaeota archaeon]|nr:hypothetical protein [Candidatus Bathyarchaeota archaeon]
MPVSEKCLVGVVLGGTVDLILTFLLNTFNPMLGGTIATVAAVQQANMIIGTLLGGFVAGYYAKPRGLSELSSLALLYAVLVTFAASMLVAVPVLLNLTPPLVSRILTQKGFYAGLVRVFISKFVVTSVAGSVGSTLACVNKLNDDSTLK